MNKPGKKRSGPEPARGATDRSTGKVRPKRSGPGGPSAAPQHDPGLQAVLDILRAKAGQDFSCYKPSTVARRIERRMALSKVATPADYARFLEDNPDEAGLLQKDLLIGVTEFFRQPQAWDVLRDDVIAPLVERAPAGSEIRIWVPGCSTGQEPYSLAILLAERIEASGKDAGFQIFATDNDPDALAAARLGSYSLEAIGDGISPARLKKFFVCREDCCQVIKEIRGRIVFAPQNLTADPPFSRLDMISCRNLLIYLDQDVQRKIITLFHFALHEGGFLFLGSAETVGDRVDLFEPVSPKWRIYRRIGVGRTAGVEIPFRPAGEISPPRTGAAVPGPLPPARQSLASTAQQLILDRFAPACVVIDRKLKVLYVHGPVEEYLTFPPGELTTRVVDMAREGLRARLGGAIAESLETHRPVSVEARVRRGPVSVPVGATVSALKFPHEIDGLLLIAFEDCLSPTAKPLRSAEGKNEFQQLQDELKVTREELQSTIAQLEGSNDQLKASNEEVTAANEELQSANEELETSKEELQSLNEELNTINARLEDKVEELEGVNNDLLNLLESTAIATVFLDKELKVKRYTPASTRLFSLIPSDLTRPIADILRRFEDETLFGDAARVLADLTPLAKEVQAEDGRWYIRRITPYRTTDDRIEGIVITFVDVCDIKRTEEALREARQQAEWLARMPGENPNPVARVSADGFTLYANPAASQTPGWRWQVGRPVPEPLRAMVIRAAAEARPIEEDVELGERPFNVTVVPVPDTKYVNVYGRDITERKKAERALQRSEEKYRLIFETANEGIWITDGERKTTLINRRMLDMLGYSREEIMGREPAEFLNPDQKPVLEKTRQAITSGSQIQQEFKFRRKDGSDLWVISAASPVVDRDGRLIRTVSMLADVTVRKRTEEELRASNDELEIFNRAAVGRELRMIELKREVNALVDRAGEPPRYRVEPEDGTS